MYVFFTKSVNYQGGEYGNAVLSRFPISKKTRYELPAAPNAPGNTEMRSLSVIEIETESGEKIYFASTHLEVSHTETRNLHVDKIRETASKLEAPFIIGVDFNAQPGSESINRITAGNMFKSGCINNSCPNTFPAAGPNRAIDFIFLNQKAQSDFTVLSYKTVNETKASDHLPVMMEIKYK